MTKRSLLFFSTFRRWLWWTSQADWGSKLWTMLDFYSMFRHVVPPRWSWTKEKFSSRHHLSLKKMRGWSWKLSIYCSCQVFQGFLVFHPKCRCTNSDANSKFMPRDRVPSLDGTNTMVSRCQQCVMVAPGRISQTIRNALPWEARAITVTSYDEWGR